MNVNYCQQHRAREAEATGSPRASVIVIAKRARGLLPHKVLHLVLELCLSGLQVHLPSSQAVRLLLKVGLMAMGTLVRRCELKCLLSKILAFDVVAQAQRGIVVDVIGVVIQAIPRKDLKEGEE